VERERGGFFEKVTLEQKRVVQQQGKRRTQLPDNSIERRETSHKAKSFRHIGPTSGSRESAPPSSDENSFED
jgi:hypothetical protein